jgi:hypothetical protein
MPPPLGLGRWCITAEVATATFPPEQGGLHQEFRERQPLMPFLQGRKRLPFLSAQEQLLGHGQGAGLQPGWLGFQQLAIPTQLAKS